MIKVAQLVKALEVLQGALGEVIRELKRDMLEEDSASAPPGAKTLDGVAAPDVKVWKVYSDTTSVLPYDVILEDGCAVRCSCPAHGPCKHLYRAEVERSGALLEARDALVRSGKVASNKAFNEHYDKVRSLIGRNAATAEAIRAGLGPSHRLANLPRKPAKEFEALAEYRKGKMK